MMEDQEQFASNKRAFTDFLDSDLGYGPYKEKVRQLIDRKEPRLIVSLDALREFNEDLTLRFRRDPLEYLSAFEESLREFVSSISPGFLKENPSLQLHVGFDGSFGRHHVTPRGLTATFLNTLVCVEGIVTRCSLVRPKVAKSVHFCPSTKEFTSREYRDPTAISGIPTSSVYPTKDKDGNLLETEYGLSTYTDHQTISIQEMPEKAPAGQLPCSVDIILDSDLVDACKPGDRIQVVGIFKTLVGKGTGHTNGLFRTVLLANNVKHLAKEILQKTMTDQDLLNIRTISQKENVVELLTTSLAPSIAGHHHIKKALLLLLLGGVEKNLVNGTHLRGDINVLMVGDPSTAKSQLLRFVLNLAPLAINTTGRGSSGVGLTAAVTSDKDTGERRLEAGAMVLADRGVVCIDEFDKMSDNDRVAIHEVMEQGTVTIAKAGIQASLNARCSVLAAANPIYGGKYNKSKPVQANVGLQDSLLSRFDLVYIILDEMDPDRDRMIADHVLRSHRYRPARHDDGQPLQTNTLEVDQDMSDSDDDESGGTAQVWEKLDKVLHMPHGRATRSRAQQLLSNAFLKKYIQYAKTRVKPVLTDQATEVLVTGYTDLRSQDCKMPVTARTLETLVRIATAHAKARLSPQVTEADAEAAADILRSAMVNSEGLAVQKPRGPRPKRADEQGEAEWPGDDGDDDDDAGDGQGKPKRSSKRKGAGKTGEDDDEMEGDDSGAGVGDPNTGDGDSSGPRKGRGRKRAIVEEGDEDETVDSSQEDPDRLKRRKDTRSSARLRAAGAQDEERSASPGAGVTGESQQPISSTRAEEFLGLLDQELVREDGQAAEALRSAINETASVAFSEAEVLRLLLQLDREEKLMFRQGRVFRA